MKTIFTLMILALIAVGCDDVQSQKPTPVVTLVVPHEVIAKENPVESHYNIFMGKVYTETVYYLILDDGRKCEVDLGTWARTKVGEKSGCQ